MFTMKTRKIMGIIFHKTQQNVFGYLLFVEIITKKNNKN